MIGKIGFVLLLSAVAGLSQPPVKCPVAANPTVELKGKVQRVHLAMGQGTPSVDVEASGKVTRVLLGAMHYLLEKDFNPKVGMDIEVKGYQTVSEVTAIQVNLPGVRKSIRLRDENGWPVWRRGRSGS